MNTLYPSAKQMLLTAQLNWTTDPLYAILLDTRYYTFSPAHTSLADVDGQAFVVSSGIMTGRTASATGVADANDLPFPASNGAVCSAMIIVRDGGTALNSKLIAYIDNAKNLPYTPNGGAVVMQWDDGPNRVFAV